MRFATLRYTATRNPKLSGRGRKSKLELYEEFSQISKQTAAAREAVDGKTAAAAAIAEAEVRQAAEGLTIERVAIRISTPGVEVSQALSEISARLVGEVERLVRVRAAAESQKKQLERLQKMGVAATALDQLVQDYRLQKQRLQAEIFAQRIA